MTHIHSFYFNQKCSAVCVVAALLTLVIISYEWKLFEKIVNSAITSQIKSLTYLKNIFSFSKFLRLAIIDWLISGSIEIKKSKGIRFIFRENEVTI